MGVMRSFSLPHRRVKLSGIIAVVCSEVDDFDAFALTRVGRRFRLRCWRHFQGIRVTEGNGNRLASLVVSASIYLKVGKSAKDGAREAQGAWTIGHDGHAFHVMSCSHLAEHNSLHLEGSIQ